jgi:hypothetical protein
VDGFEMFTILKETKNGQRGQVLAIALILMAVGFLIVPAALSYAYSVARSNLGYEQNTSQLYSADSGLQDALFKLNHDFSNAAIPKFSGQEGTPYLLAAINGVTSLSAQIDCISFSDSEVTYRISSTATRGSSTLVTAYCLGSSPFFDNAATSLSPMTNKGTITGNVAAPSVGGQGEIRGDLYGTSSGGQNVTGSTYPFPNPPPIWPVIAQIESHYQTGLPGASSISSIDTYGTHSIGPLQTEGDLEISSSTSGGDLVLTGTVYVNGDLTTGQGNGKSQTIHLNGHTIFCAGSVQIDQNCSFDDGLPPVSGSGAIICVGSLYYSPNVAGSPNDFIFVMSLASDVTFKPGNNFYGSVAAGAGINFEVFPGVNLTHTDPTGKNIDFPISQGSLNFTPRNWTSSKQ